MRKPGDHHRRLLRHHLPLALASAAALVVFMTVPTFDVSADRGSADLSSGALPQQRGERAMEHGEDEPAPTGHGAAPRESSGHGGDEGGSISHGGGQDGSTGHGGGQGGTTEPQDGQTDPPQPDATMDMTGNRSLVQRFTVATGYIATGLLAVTLLIGPANLLLRRRNPVSGYLRRDVGMWTAVFSVIHVVSGLQVHGTLSDFIAYFVAPDGSLLLNSFGLGNWTGLAATVIVVGLLAISSDFALRKLSARPWKRLQRLNYALFALVLAHAFFYGALLRVASPFTLLLGLSVAAVFVGQAMGIWLWRRRRSPASSA
jgi:DMSO/TMAO reductase YedYZ heme-binding membrane subunit